MSHNSYSIFCMCISCFIGRMSREMRDKFEDSIRKAAAAYLKSNPTRSSSAFTIHGQWDAGAKLAGVAIDEVAMVEKYYDDRGRLAKVVCRLCGRDVTRMECDCLELCIEAEELCSTEALVEMAREMDDPFGVEGGESE